jgi:antitoxin (DNA-binding transcriptional repressor) of toxin-antitoxin stability system
VASGFFVKCSAATNLPAFRISPTCPTSIQKLVDLVNLIKYGFFQMRTVATNEAKTHLSALLHDVSCGETIVIARGRKPLAKLVPYAPEQHRPLVGEMIDEPMTVPDEALKPLNKDQLLTWGLS